jgi:hypothetical protein
MEDNKPVNNPRLDPNASLQSTASTKRNQQKTTIGIVIIGIFILAVVIASVYFLSTTDITTTSRIRDIFIIFMALESLIIGIALIILVLQLATLINLLQNEIKPILNTTNETVNTLRGTTTFLSNNLVEPVIKLNQYLAAIKRLIDLVRIPRL